MPKITTRQCVIAERFEQQRRLE